MRLLEAFMGASSEEITADSVCSFYNGAESSIYMDDISAAGGALLRQLEAVFGVEPHDGAPLASRAERFLKEKLRMSGAQMEALKARLAS